MIESQTRSECLAAALRRDILGRRIRSGFAALDNERPLLEHLQPAEPGGAQLVWRISQWADAGWHDDGLIGRLLARYTPCVRSILPLKDYAGVRMAEGMVAMSHEYADAAIRHFDAVLNLRTDLNDHELLAIAHFWKARCLRGRGEYDNALTHTAEAKQLAIEGGFDLVAAVIQVLESWLFFQKSKHKEALRILAEAESALKDTDDLVVLGNIQSTYGRIYRQEGRYDQAVRDFEAAIETYRTLDAEHPNLARTLANLAYVKRLIAMELRRKIDAPHARRDPGNELADGRRGMYRTQFSTLCAEAFEHLDDAERIYARHPNHRGAGTVHVNRGLLHLDNGALDLAEAAGVRAFALGEERDDAILMARARILQCMVENAKLEEGIEDDPRRHAHAALEYIRDAIELARATQNRRLLARAHTWHGLTLSNDFFEAREDAVQALNTASGFLGHGFHDTAWDDLRTLKTRLSRSQTVDETLRAWSQGATGTRTFREISDDFAAFLIPKIWEAENRRIARVATRLAISPKKVRRALVRAGLLDNPRSGSAGRQDKADTH